MSRPPKKRSRALLLATVALLCVVIAFTLKRQPPAPSFHPAAPAPKAAIAQTNTAAATTNSAAPGDDDRVVTLVAEGNELLKQREFVGAAEYFKQAINLRNDSVPAIYQLALSYLSAGNREAAIELHTKLKVLNPELAEQLWQRLNR